MASGKQPINLWNRRVPAQRHNDPMPPQRCPTPATDKPPVKFGRWYRPPTTPQRQDERPSPQPVVVQQPYVREPFTAPPMPALEMTFRTHVTSYDADGLFHVRCMELFEQLQELKENWQREFAASPSLDVTALRYGVPCLVRYYQDKLWYRATYLGLRNNLRHVFYEDFGAVDFVYDPDYKAVDPAAKIGYEIPGTVYTCRLAHPTTLLKYAYLTQDDTTHLRTLVKGEDVEVFVVDYQSVRLHGRERVVLLVDAFKFTPTGKENVLTLLLEKNPNIEFKNAYPEPVTFDSEPHLRACSVLQFPPPHRPPFGERMPIKLLHVMEEERAVYLAYVPVPEAEWEEKSSQLARVIYADANIVSLMERGWMRDVATLNRARMLNVNSSYLLQHEDRVCRVEVVDVTLVDKFLCPLKLGVELIDHGVEFDVEAGEILDFPPVISFCVAKQSFSATISLEPNSNEKSMKKGSAGGQAGTLDGGSYTLVDSFEKLRSLVGTVVQAVFFQDEETNKIGVRIFVVG